MAISAQNLPVTGGCTLAVVLQPRFPMAELMAIVDWLQAANEAAGEERFVWLLCSAQATPVVADNGMVLTALRDTSQLTGVDMLVVLSGLQTQNSEQSLKLSSGIPEPLPERLAATPAALFTGQGYQMDDLLPSTDTQALISTDDLMSALLLAGLSPGEGEVLLAQCNKGLTLQIGDSRIHRALALMRENLELPLDNRELAARTCLSVRQLERLFRRYFDETPARYYTRIRLQSARRLLRSQRASVTEAALACGFGSLPHFCRIYRERFGVTPGRDR
ncbi:MAG: helix-turn-helix domain-containing protein [Marinobacterium sp.]|nr:helix-turn-helix domain-containing protein [Marinobacterium sp.]